MTLHAVADTAETPDGPQGPSGEPVGLRVPLSATTIEKLVANEQAVALAERIRDAYQAGVCDALGFPIERVRALDIDRGELVVDAE